MFIFPGRGHSAQKAPSWVLAMAVGPHHVVGLAWEECQAPTRPVPCGAVLAGCTPAELSVPSASKVAAALASHHQGAPL